MDNKSLEKLELNKILSAVAEFAALDNGKALILACQPSTDLIEVRRRLDITEECDKLLYTYGVGKIEVFPDLKDNLVRASKGSILSCKELLDCAALMRSARIAYTSIEKIEEELPLTKLLTKNIHFDRRLEDDICDKIISVDALSDNASDRLYSIRVKIKSLNARIREKLAEYSSGKYSEFLQDGIVTIRNDRYVVPVKAEHKNHIKGFIHDRSKTGSTFFIEPEYILELNNELIALTIDEREEIEAILKSLSNRVGSMSEVLERDIEILAELDSRFAIAEYCYSKKCTKPKVNNRGCINIVKGRHPLIDKDKVVPVSIELGEKYNFLLLSGANTGGKTVTLKTCGLFCLMASCGLYIPASEGSSVGVFENVFCDIGDSQSIEESLSTFSSHITNIINICNNAYSNSLVLIDELGGGTNPDEGQAIAKSVVKHLLERGAKGVVTTHFTPLKEFAYTVGGIENASMEFDSDNLKPLYRIKIGLPGASNALAISRRLGMSAEILERAESYLSEGARSFENVVRRAEESRIEAERKLAEVSSMQREWREKLDKVNAQIAELNREKEKIARSARTESRRIITERTEQAEEMLAAIEEIFKKKELKEADLIAARTLKNRLKDKAFDEEENKKQVTDYIPATAQNLKVGIFVFVKPMDSRGQVVAFNATKGEAEVQCGSLKMHLKLKDLLIIGEEKAKPKSVKIVKKLPKSMPVLEINVLGMNVEEALYEVDNFIDRAVTDNLEEIKVIHGVGTGKLRNAISEHLKRHKNVESYRLGKYGEGETGVTFIKLK
ncbi:MAG: endonuclease MutS2 [Clostridia bacterium]|nr:endonuclease MutS2 [Clostridia bacterium]